MNLNAYGMSLLVSPSTPRPLSIVNYFDFHVCMDWNLIDKDSASLFYRRWCCMDFIILVQFEAIIVKAFQVLKSIKINQPTSMG